MARFNIISWILLVGQLVLKTTNGEFPGTVSISILNDDEIITLNWERVDKFLANENVPLWSVRENANPVLIPNVMKNLGPFAMYHDVEKSSAVVYFEQSNSFFGIIDTRFYIDGLPFSEIKPGEHHKVNELYVKRRVDLTQSFHDDLPNVAVPSVIPVMDIKHIHSMFDLIISSKASSSSTDSTKGHYQGDILYAEILVFVTNDIVQNHMTEHNGLQSLAKDYMIYLNAVDMLYAKLMKNGIVIHINIAGLVIEEEPAAFDFLRFVTTEENDPVKFLDTEQTFSEFQAYLTKQKLIFVEDLFDFFFLSTGYVLQRGNLELKGIALSELNTYDNRLDGYHDPLGLIVQHQTHYGDYITTAHELAHGMGVTHDSKFGGRQCDGAQCFAILQEVGSYCKNCLIWSEKSRQEFGIYIRTNRNHCFLLNQPRSLHPYGTVVPSISPHQQCVCYGFQTHISTPFYLDAVGKNDCENDIACSIDGEEISDLPTPQPVDGTPCDVNKVCWQKVCRTLPSKVKSNTLCSMKLIVK